MAQDDILSVLPVPTDKCIDGANITDTDTSRSHLRNCQSVNDIDMVASSSQFISDRDKHLNEQTVTPTKIKLNFSVDRLLNFETNNSDSFKRNNKNYQNNCNLISNNNNNSSVPNDFIINNSDILARYECCKYLNGNYVHHHHNQNHPSHSHGGGLLNFFNNDDTIVRPKPIRVIGNSINPGHASQMSIPPFAHAQSSMFLGQRVSTTSLSSINCTINRLKSLQNNQRFRPTSIPHKTDNNSTTSLVNVSVSNTSNGTPSTSTNGKRKRSWSRAVFSNLQRKGLEIQFQQQKYITKPDRRKLAARLNLTDAQVKVWFQNRRMKWRHTRENLKSGQEKPVAGSSSTIAAVSNKNNSNQFEKNSRKSPESEGHCYSTSSDDDNEDEIDVVE